ncbi:hypothetical protein ABH920_001841 [Catenulispora sp. EB89]
MAAGEGILDRAVYDAPKGELTVAGAEPAAAASTTAVTESPAGSPVAVAA